MWKEGCRCGRKPDLGRLQGFNRMGLLTILKKVKQKEKEMRVLLLGLDNAGMFVLSHKIVRTLRRFLISGLQTCVG